MDDIKLEHFLDLAWNESELWSPTGEAKSKPKLPRSEAKKKTAKKRKRTSSEDETKEDIPKEDLHKFTFTDIDLSRINGNQSEVFESSQLNGTDLEETHNDAKENTHSIFDQWNGISLDETQNYSNEEGYGKFQQYNKDNKWKLAKIPHHFLPSFNLTRFTDFKHLRDYPLLRTSLPHSVYVSPLHLNKVDICHRRTRALSAYMYRIKALQTAYFTARKKSKQVRKGEKNGVYDKTLVDFIMCRDNHPDKFFERDYDFYYSGGNLCADSRNKHVLHASGNNMENLNLSLFLSSEKPVLQDVGSFNLEDSPEESEIFEVQFSNAADDAFFLRRKHSVTMVGYKNDTFSALNSLQSTTVPMISFAHGMNTSNQLAITNLNHQVRLYDVENSAVVQKFKMLPKKEITPASNWNMIRAFDRDVYLYAACRKISFIDTRVPQDEWESNFCGFDEESYCATFCSMAVSGFDGLFYAGSNHKAYCVDARYMGHNIESKNTAVARWTHQMTSCPLMMAVNRHEDNEYLVLQSPQSADLRICENMRFVENSTPTDVPTKKLCIDSPTEYSYKSPCLPYMPETLESIFQSARKNGSCIKPDAGIASRIKACNTGLTFTGPSSNPFILTATSNGDVFARHMFDPKQPDDSIDKASAVEVMTEYEASISKSAKHPPPLSVTEVCDFSGISKVFRCAAFSDTKPDDDTVGVPKRKFMGRWQKSFSRLCKYKDALVTDLLAIWDIEEPEEKNMNLTDIFNGTQSDRKSLVSSWLNSTQAIKTSTQLSMTAIPLDSFNDITAGLDTLCETMKHEDSQNEIAESPIVAKPKSSKKKNRYVKGF